MDDKHAPPIPRPLGVNLIIALQIASILGTLAGWPLIVTGVLPVPAPEFPISYAWPFGDFLIALPISATATIGLWRMRTYGLWASLLYCGAVLYGTPVLIALAVIRDLAPVSVIELPSYPLFALSIVIILYLWHIRERFTR